MEHWSAALFSSGAPWIYRFIATYSYQEALEEDGVAESLPNI